MNLSGKQVVVVGMGRTGLSCVRFLCGRGAFVIANDGGSEPGEWVDEARALGARPVWGEHPPDLFAQADLVVVSPGVPHTLGFLQTARERNIPVIGEIELAFRFVKAPILAVTGTNGKTTTTTLLGEMLKQSGFDVFVGGNIGTPLIDHVAEQTPADRVVVEVSSFQLDTIVSFRPSAAVLLNITEDHMDRYPDFAAYVHSKGRIFENQTAEDTAILNGSDSRVLAAADRIKSRKWFFNRCDVHHPGAVRKGSRLEIQAGGSRFSLDLFKTPLEGAHNRENIAAAALAALAAGGTPAGIRTALARFRGLPHRLAYVETVNGVRYYDDSKGTNVDAVVRALETFQEPVILIMGGRGKGGGYGPLKNPIRRGVKQLIAMGETREAIKTELGPVCARGAEIVASIEDAVRSAAEAAEPGDVVLLSPSGSSFDMFTSYSHRGECFCRAVQALKSKEEHAALSAGV
ncbi:MAG: UDP-N-acetylmuramoyl-L-alanine--D-glutamate ligase [Thermodesulfobacteriota bacterium]